MRLHAAIGLAGVCVALGLPATAMSAEPCNRTAAQKVGDEQLLTYADEHAADFFDTYGGASELGYMVAKVICRDLDRDGEREMAVQMTCCTGGSPSPWGVFRRDAAGDWELVYARAVDTVFRLTERGRVLRATMPAPYEGACTRFVRDRTVRWSSGRFRSRLEPRRRTGADC
jgi:hypothetical protein